MKQLLAALILVSFPLNLFADYCLYTIEVSTNNIGDTIRFNGEKRRTGGRITLFEGMLRSGEPVDIEITRGKSSCAGALLFYGDEINLECGDEMKADIEFTTQGDHPICFESKLKAKTFMKLRRWF